MKMMCRVAVSLSLLLLSAPLLFGQDLSKYRTFSLGTSLPELSKQIGPYSQMTTLVHQRPAIMQEMTVWPLNSSRISAGGDPVSQILFSFYNGELYRMVVTYNLEATKGLDDDDMVQAVSARYGAATRFYPELNFPSHAVFAFSDTFIARWQDAQNSVYLYRSSNQSSYLLAVFSKQRDAQAKASSIESEKLDKQDARQTEIDRPKKEADDLQLARQSNQKSFRP
jgi:hypothetical protein